MQMMVMLLGGAASYTPMPGGSRQVALRPRVTQPVSSAAAFGPVGPGSSGSGENVVLRDSLMSRTVATQVQVFGQLHERGLQIWLNKKFTSFAEANKGHLTDFIKLVQNSEPEDVWVPMRTMRQLSPGNPYRPKGQGEGFNCEVQPQVVASKLMAVRESLAETWVGELDHLACDGCVIDPAEDANNVLSISESSSIKRVHSSCGQEADLQLLHAIATRRAIQEMLHDLELLPSQAHVHEWLSKFALVQHATDLTPEGKVDNLLNDLGSQTLHIRGRALVDPLAIQNELKCRTGVITLDMAENLRDVTLDHMLLQASFLESCLGGSPPFSL